LKSVHENPDGSKDMFLKEEIVTKSYNQRRKNETETE
jgi:hypothetical protein